MKKVFILILTILIFAPAASSAYAYTLTSRESLAFDESLYVKDQEVYAFPEKILITQIEGAPRSVADNSEAWMDLLYYYFITRLEFVDLPFNYLFDRQGNVFQGRNGWDGVIPELSEPEGAIMIAYLSNGSDITGPADSSLEDLIEDLSYKYGIERTDVEIVELSVVEGSEEEPSSLQYELVRDIFAEEVSERLDRYKYSKEDHMNMAAQVSDVTYSAEVDSNAKFEVTATLKNIGETPWFTLNDFVYVVTADGEDSEFAVNKEWDSFDTPLHIEGETIFPEDTYEVKFNMQAPFFPGDYEESFGVKRLRDTGIVEGTSFKVSVKVNKGDMKLVEILETGIGALNVRATPAYNGEQVAQVPTGEVFIMVEKSGQWYKIKYEDDKEGWVFGEYVKEL